jgi:hypothetical protein
MKIKRYKAGLIVGALVAGLHLIWSALVSLGWAQPVLDFIYKMHFLNNPYIVQAFDPLKVVYLVLMTFVGGYIAGWLFGLLFNELHKK